MDLNSVFCFTTAHVFWELSLHTVAKQITNVDDDDVDHDDVLFINQSPLILSTF